MMPRISAAEGLHVAGTQCRRRACAASSSSEKDGNIHDTGSSNNDGNARREKNYWENPRDHARRKVRKEIWERVHGCSVQEWGEVQGGDRHMHHVIETPEGAAASAPSPDKALEYAPEPEPEPPTREQVASILWRIVKDDCSFFSLATLHRLRDRLETPVDVALLYEDNDASEPRILQQATDPVDKEQCLSPSPRPVASERLRSMLGLAGYQEFRERLRHVRTFTFYEYAVWVGRLRVVGAMLLGGINPCARGLRSRGGVKSHVDKPDYNNHRSDDRALADLCRLGREVVVPTLFDGVPLALSTYLVKRAVELRWGSCMAPPGASLSNNSTCFTCPLCPNHGDLSASVMLQFDSSPHCSHCFCEPCFWKELVRNLTDRRHHDDVVVCPVCAVNRCDKDKGIGNQSIDASLLSSPSERRQQSLEKFRALPTNAAELKAFASFKKNRVKQLRPAVASTWSEAVQPLSGRSQEVRLDRFWRYVADPHGTHHHRVRGCLEAGVDVLETNQYGQTPLFVAAFVGNVRVVELLLEYYSPEDVRATTTAHGGVTLLGAAKANGHHAVVRTLLDFLETDPAGDEVGTFSTSDGPLESLRHDVDASRSCKPTFTVLISPEVDHAGAGSYLIDDCLSARSLEVLTALWADLPEAVDTKKKDVPCSTRRYFCDAEGRIQEALVAAMKSCFGLSADCQVFPHMRFLRYSEPNTALASHLDLPRTDMMNGMRSTHTLLLYLTDCVEGGATCLLGSLDKADRTVLARVQPRRARLFLFPHECPHEGEAVVDVPKLLLRGEARLPQNY